MVGLAGADAHSRLAADEEVGASASRPTSPSSRRPANHLLLDRPLSGEAVADRAAVLDALRRGPVLHRPRRPRPRRRLPLHGRRRRGAALHDGRPRGSRATACAPGPGGACPRGRASSCSATGGRWRRAPGFSTPPSPAPASTGSRRGCPGWRVPWVITNPVYVLDEATRESRRRAGGLARTPPPRRRVFEPLAALPGQATFGAEFDPTSWMDPAVVDPGAGPGGGPALKLAFRLGVPSRLPAVHLVRAREPAGARPRPVLRPALPHPGGRRVPPLGAGARRQPRLRRRGTRVVAGLRPHVRASGARSRSPSRGSAPSTRGPTAVSTPRRPVPWCSCSTARR